MFTALASRTLGRSLGRSISRTASWNAAPTSTYASRMFAADAKAKIIYTKTDEAPMLATYAFLPIIKRFSEPIGVDVELADISVAARILAQFNLVPDTLSELGALCKTPAANIIKLPNISASIPQLIEAVTELQSKGFSIPDFPAIPSTPAEEEIRAKYAKVLGSAVNPVLREGNSDRRAAAPVKAFAQRNPKKMGAWAKDCRSHVAHMNDGDFFSSEVSYVVGSAPMSVRIEHIDANGAATTLKSAIPLQIGEVVDSSRMSAAALIAFFEDEICAAKKDDILLSLHLKATMMKVSDPIMFGHAVRVYFADVFAKYATLFGELGVNANNGIGDVMDKIAGHSQETSIVADIAAVYAKQPRLAMVDSRNGITNLHRNSDVIIDASMPNVVRDSGGMWNGEDALEDVKCLIPDRCYATFYAAVLDDCRINGQFDAATMGHTSNVGLMAQKAEEYGSHPFTFEQSAKGTVNVVDEATDTPIMSHSVEKGDIWRLCTVKDAPIRDWVRLAVSRARESRNAAIFWLDEKRAHDANMIAKVKEYLKDSDTKGLDIEIMAPELAAERTCSRARSGRDTISVTGNVLRDYLTDLFPILELGTSAKMLSIVPLLAGGGLYETGAGGSAPKHVQQMQKEGHLRWDSLGEYLAFAVCCEEMGKKNGDDNARLLGETLTAATAKLLDENQSPSRKVNEIDNRGSGFYIAKYWAEAMAEKRPELFGALAKELASAEEQITKDLIACQGKPHDIGGYYMLDDAKAEQCMRPSATLNKLIDAR